MLDSANVAPCVGAWIETSLNGSDYVVVSHPVWVRGLKHFLVRCHKGVINVAPCVGAWIETLYVHKTSHTQKSSHPVWVRGLKPASDKPTMFDMRVAPCVGAWIETRY